MKLIEIFYTKLVKQSDKLLIEYFIKDNKHLVLQTLCGHQICLNETV